MLKRLTVALLFTTTLTACGKECRVTTVDATGSPAHIHTSSTVFDTARTYSAALTAATAGSAHDHDITLTESDVNGMAAGPIDVTSSATNSHSHTVGINCVNSGLLGLF